VTPAEALTRKVGPLPVWAWAAGASGVIIIGVRIYRGSGSAGESEPEPQPDAGAEDGVLEEWSTPIGGNYSPTIPPANPGGWYEPEPSTDDTDTGQPTTNAAWRTLAIDRLVASQGYRPTDVADALGLYLRGRGITVRQEALVNEAVRAVGAPPEGAPPITRADPAPNVAPPNPNPGRYKVRKGDTLRSISRRAYGDATDQYLNKLMRSNGLRRNQQGNVTPWRVGMVLVLPVIDGKSPKNLNG
jgi:LysM repeat protein